MTLLPPEMLTGFPVAISIEIAVPLAEQELSLGMGADLLACVPPARGPC